MIPPPLDALRYAWTIALAFPSKRWRSVLFEGWRLERNLSRMLDEYPLPKLMEQLTPPEVSGEASVRDRERVRRIADAVVGLDVRARTGLCLRQSLVRYRLLRLAGVPLTICFGARKRAGTVVAAARLTGHAWLVLRGIPYAEDHQHYRDFTVMFMYPESRQLELEL